jgi:hypothetical protein
MTAIIAVLLLDLILGMGIRAFTRRAAWSVLASLVVPPLTAVLPFGTNALLVDTDPAHYHAILGFAYLTAFGFAAFCTGTLFGYLLKPGPTIKGSDA